MLPDRVSNPGPLTYESGALPIALRGPAPRYMFIHMKRFKSFQLFMTETLVTQYRTSVFATFNIWSGVLQRLSP